MYYTSVGEINYVCTAEYEYEYKLRSEVNRKLRTFAALEYPLLAGRGFNLTISSKDLTISSKVGEGGLVAQHGQSEGRVNHETIQKASPRWDSDPRQRVYETLLIIPLRSGSAPSETA